MLQSNLVPKKMGEKVIDLSWALEGILYTNKLTKQNLSVNMVKLSSMSCS